MRIARIYACRAARVVAVLAFCLFPSGVRPYQGHEHVVQEPGAEPTVLDAIGALHPVAVHFPVALLLTAALSEGMLIVTKRESLRDTTRLLVALGAAGAVISASLGWIAASGEAGSLSEDKADLLEWHRWAGTATASLSLVLLLVSERAARLGGRRGALRAARMVVALSVGTAGYLGGELVHGDAERRAAGGAFLRSRLCRRTRRGRFPGREAQGTGRLHLPGQGVGRARQPLRGGHDGVDHVGSRRPIHPEYVAATLDELAGSDTVFTIDTGMCCVWGARYLHAARGRRLLGSFNHGSVANALPQAIGAQLTYPERQVVSLSGDGGFAMLMGDLLTLNQYELPVKIILFNNHELGMVELEMEVACYPHYGTELKNPNFAELAKAIGLMGIRVEDPKEVRPALQKVLASNGPALLDVVTDPNVLAMPPKATVKQAKGFALAMTKMTFTGELDDVMDTVMANWRNL